MHTKLRPLYALALAVALLLGAGWSESQAQEEERPPIDLSARQLPGHALAAEGLPAPGTGASAVPGAFGYGIDAFNEVYNLFPLDTPSNTTTIAPISLLNDFGDEFPGGGVIGDDPNTAYVVANTTLYEVDVQTGAVTQVGTMSTDFGITGLAYDTTTDTYYAVTGDFGSDPNATGSLYEIDVTTATATLVGSLTGSDILLDAAFDDTGTLYGIDRDTDELYEIDTATGAATVVGGLGFDANFDTGMSFDTLSGDMYFFGLRSVGGNFAAEWYTVDLATGSATLVEALPGLAQYGWFDAEAITDPQLAVSPSAIDYGNVSTDAGATADVTLESIGLADVDVSALTITGPDAAEFSIAAAPGTPFTIASGTLETVTIGFDPTSGGDKTATLEITSNTGGTAGTVTTVDLSGFGVAPIASYPYVVDFEDGGTLPGGWSQQASPVEGKVWEFTDGVGDGFGSDHGATEDHTTGSGFYAYLEDSTPDDPPASLVTPPLDFSSLSAPRLSFWYQNAGSDTDPGAAISELRIDVSTNGGSTFDPADADLLVITQRVDDWTQFFVSLAPYAGETNVAVRFRGVETDGFESNPALDDVAIQEAPTVGEIAVSPDAIDFGTVATGSTASETITITNNGGGDLEVTDLTISGTDAGQFQLANAPALPVIIAAGTDATFDAVFAPTAGGDLTAQVEITSDDGGTAGTISTVDLAGFGNAPVTSYPYVVDFENGGTLPGGWVQQASPAGDVWEFTDGIGDGIGSDYGATEDHTTGSGFYAFLDDSTPTDTPASLVTPPLDFSSLSAPRVAFWYQNAGADTDPGAPISELRIDVSLDGGTTFDPADADLLVIDQRVDDWTLFSVDLAPYAGETSVAIRFRGIESPDFQSNPALDDVEVGEPAGATFSVSPDTGEFRPVLTTEAGAFVQTYTVTNTGGGTLTVEQPTTSGSDAGTFLIGNASQSFPADLGSAESVSFDITLDTPLAVGTYSADLSIPFDDGSGTQTETIGLLLTINDPNYGGGSLTSGGYFYANSTAGAAASPSQPGVGDYSITGTPTDVTLADDDVAGPITLPFTFRFYGTDYTEVWLSSNGWLSFTDPGGDSVLGNAAIPTAGSVENLIAWFWDDLDPGDVSATGGSIQYGSDADGNFVIAFDRIPPFVGGGPGPDAFITATVVLSPGVDASTDGNVRIQYEEIGAGFGSIDEATIGIENEDGTLGVQYLFDGTGGPVLDSGAPMALVFGPSATGLPVELAAFDALAASEQEVDLTWQTASETNNAGFYVEHRRLAADGTAAAEWSDLGFVDGTGTTTEAQTYRFRATGLAPGRHAFRLRQIDFDGTSSLSEEIETDLQLRGPYALSGAYPNPFTERSQLDVTVRETQRVTVTVYDVLGRRVATAYDGVVEASQPVTVEFSARGLSSGVYFYRVEGERFRATERMTLVR